MEHYYKVEHSKACLDRAFEFLNEAISTAGSNQFLATSNRSYYAVYTAIRALVILEHTEKSKHRGTIGDFQRFYIKTGIFKKEYSGYVEKLFRTREKCDYDPIYIIIKEDALLQLEHAKEIVADISEYLRPKYTMHK